MRYGLLKDTKTCKLNFCEHCVVGKKTRVKFGTANHDTREILKYIHSDVWGPTKNASIGGSYYFITFVDDFSRRVWMYTMRAKDEVLEIFMKWKKLVETQSGRKIKVLRSDNGGKYTSDPFLQICQNEGIKRHFTVRYTAQQNGMAERVNRTLLEKVRCMLSNVGVNKKFWDEAMSYASHLVKRLPFATIGGGVKGFKLWNLEDKKFVCSRDVTFDETSMMKASSSQQVENKTKEVLQRVEFDATPYVPVSSTSKNGSTIEVTTRVEEEVRLVAKGFAQKEGIDYNDVLSPVVKHTSIRILLALVAEYELELAQLDVKTTFLHGDLEEKIYMTQPCGFKVAGKENHVCRLIKSLYGQKQSPRQCMDDKTKPVCTPLTPHFKLSSSPCHLSQEERDYMARVPYTSVVGSLMYAMVCTMPDISQAVSMVSRYMHNPGKNHWLAVKWILQYLYGTVDVGLLFKKDCGQQCVGYCDSDFAGDFDKRRSTTGYVFTLGGGPVSWRSILQSTIALPTTEAKYMAATEAIKEVIWLKGLLGDLEVIQENIASSVIIKVRYSLRRIKHITLG
ncbi:Integrase catalytic domain-containing protein [Citrus sinensis]|nr:Integrase catalytic domain-containing protein [Citrus sinensis]